MTKIERKAYYEECKRELRRSWKIMSDESSEEEVEIGVPSNFKSYTIHDRKIVLQ